MISPESLLMAVGLGLYTAILPCPLATNIAAISFLGRHAGSKRKTFVAGLLYAMGRTITYLTLCMIILYTTIGQYDISNFFETHINRIMGPLLIVAGMFMCKLLELPVSGISIDGNKYTKFIEKHGVLGAFPIGVIFALAFCPLTLITFGNFILLAIKEKSALAMPVAYGVSTALPVVAFAFLVSFFVREVGKAYGRTNAIERCLGPIAGTVFILVGIYYSLIYIFKVL